MTKDELVSAVLRSLQDTPCRNFGREDVKTVIEHTLGNISDAVFLGQAVTLRGFGTFQTQTRKAKKGRNISAGTTIEIPARTVVTFKPSKHFNTPNDL